MIDRGLGGLTKLYMEAVNTKRSLDKEAAIRIANSLYPKLERAAMKRHRWYDINGGFWGPSDGTLKALVPILQTEGYTVVFTEENNYLENAAYVRVSGWAD